MDIRLSSLTAGFGWEASIGSVRTFGMAIYNIELLTDHVVMSLFGLISFDQIRPCVTLSGRTENLLRLPG